MAPPARSAMPPPVPLAVTSTAPSAMAPPRIQPHAARAERRHSPRCRRRRPLRAWCRLPSVSASVNVDVAAGDGAGRARWCGRCGWWPRRRPRAPRRRSAARVGLAAPPTSTARAVLLRADLERAAGDRQAAARAQRQGIGRAASAWRRCRPSTPSSMHQRAGHQAHVARRGHAAAPAATVMLAGGERDACRHRPAPPQTRAVRGSTSIVPVAPAPSSVRAGPARRTGWCPARARLPAREFAAPLRRAPSAARRRHRA